MNKNYTKLEKHQGIYKNKKTKRYLAVKKIYRVQYSESFDKVRDAIHWRRTFNGTAQVPVKRIPKPEPPPTQIVTKTTPTLLKVWDLMRKLHFPSVEMNTVSTWERQFKVLKNLHDIHMEDFLPSIIDKWIKDTKEYYSTGINNRRYTLKRELDLLRTIFRWYKNEPEVGDYRFASPLLDRHKKSCVVKPLPIRKKKIAPDDALKFINLMPPLYRDLALFQYLTASRIGEAAGMQTDNV